MPWASTGAPILLSSATVEAVAGSSVVAVHTSIPTSDANMLAAYGVTSSQSYLKATIVPSDNDTKDTLYPHHAWLTPIKDAQLDSSNIEIRVTQTPTQISDNVFAFAVVSSVTAPFLWLDLDVPLSSNTTSSHGNRGVTNFAGWFSDNNFLAEAGVEYQLTYTVYHANNTNDHTFAPLSLETFTSSLRVRALQTIY